MFQFAAETIYQTNEERIFLREPRPTKTDMYNYYYGLAVKTLSIAFQEFFC